MKKYNYRLRKILIILLVFISMGCSNSQKAEQQPQVSTVTTTTYKDEFQYYKFSYFQLAGATYNPFFAIHDIENEVMYYWVNGNQETDTYLANIDITKKIPDKEEVVKIINSIKSYPQLNLSFEEINKNVHQYTFARFVEFDFSNCSIYKTAYEADSNCLHILNYYENEGVYKTNVKHVFYGYLYDDYFDFE